MPGVPRLEGRVREAVLAERGVHDLRARKGASQEREMDVEMRVTPTQRE